jgi:hypothetical protein
LKRTPLKRKPMKRGKTNATTKADVLFSRLVRDRDHCCLMCGSPNNLQAAHIWSRRYRALRWRFENCITLDAACHMRMTLDPAAWAEWCEGQFFCNQNGLHGNTEGFFCKEAHTFWDYPTLRHRALFDPPEKAADALERLKAL